MKFDLSFDWDFTELVDFAYNLSGARFEKTMQNVAKRLAKALLKWIESYTPVDEYTLINGWDNNKFAVKRVDNGFEVLIVNDTQYALDVNDGHKAHNQYGGPYPIKHRVKVRSPHQWQKGDATYYVFGHFFVERGILHIKNTSEIENIIMDELQKWWDGA